MDLPLALPLRGRGPKRGRRRPLRTTARRFGCTRSSPGASTCGPGASCAPRARSIPRAAWSTWWRASRIPTPARRASERPPLAVGLFVEAEILGRRVDAAVMLPRAALRRDETGPGEPAGTGTSCSWSSDEGRLAVPRRRGAAQRARAGGDRRRPRRRRAGVRLTAARAGGRHAVRVAGEPPGLARAAPREAAPESAAVKRAIAWFATNHVAANLMMFLLIVGGLSALPAIHQKIFPDINVEVIAIGVPYLGAAPEEVEEGVCVRIEEEIQGIEGIEQITLDRRRRRLRRLRRADLGLSGRPGPRRDQERRRRHHHLPRGDREADRQPRLHPPQRAPARALRRRLGERPSRSSASAFATGSRRCRA